MDLIFQTALQSMGELPLEALWATLLGFVVLMVSVPLFIGLGTKNLSVGALGAYSMFGHIALFVSDEMITNVFVVTLALVVLGLSFEVWNMSMGSDTA